LNIGKPERMKEYLADSMFDIGDVVIADKMVGIIYHKDNGIIIIELESGDYKAYESIDLEHIV
jgi:hypothetical protein